MKKKLLLCLVITAFGLMFALYPKMAHAHYIPCAVTAWNNILFNDSVQYGGRIFCAQDIEQGRIKSTLQEHRFLIWWRNVESTDWETCIPLDAEIPCSVSEVSDILEPGKYRIVSDSQAYTAVPHVHEESQSVIGGSFVISEYGNMQFRRHSLERMVLD